MAAELCEAAVAWVVSGVALTLMMDGMPCLHGEKVLTTRVRKELVLCEPEDLRVGSYV